MGRLFRWLVVALGVLLSSTVARTQPGLDANTERLLAALIERPIVLLGEVHDNAYQHALRARALRALIERGVRPAIAFEQFDREQQAIIDIARREQPADGVTLARHLLARVGTPGGWNWEFYLPYLQLALDHDLPIVAANLSRRDAMRVANDGFAAVFDEQTVAAFRLDALPEHFVAAHREAIDAGHCGLLPASALPKLARAQIARDVAMVQALRPHISHNVVLLAGNAHLRTDVGLPFFLTAPERSRTTSIALLEEDSAAPSGEPYDVVIVTPRQARADPCAALQRAPLRNEPVRP